ncbi:MAG: DEAD/DEAH box helicase family protein [Gammaproteobacteria bacterium]|nr:DEAD/DEAH box helicase family protein [Gammaproteobacteria bacterium]
MPFETLKFRYPWRPYQQRVLDAIDSHLDDNRLHVVAAPGAGKTTLGLEIFRRLRKATLVLSPTRVIRDQWIERLSDYCDTSADETLPWISRDLHQPATLTSVTYQAIHSQLSEELATIEDEAELLELDEGVTATELHAFIQTLKAGEIEVIILDEAHHLRSEWWRALDRVCQDMPELTLVSLTATPPYDAEDHGWNRYEALCGPIDEEISVPELVKAGTLCPHQDYIWAVDVSKTERKEIREYDDRVSRLCTTLIESSEFAKIIQSHPWLSDDQHEQEILQEPQVAIAILVFLNEKQMQISPALLSTLDLQQDDIPELGRHWWQTLISAVLFSKTFTHSESHQKSVDQLKKQLRASELLHKRKLSVERSRRLSRSLSLSSSKVEACVNLHKLEYKHRGERLRQVVLTDYIRDEALVTGLDTGKVNLGAWPIFRELTSASPIASQIGMLSGRLSIIHRDVLDEFLSLVAAEKFDTEPMGGQGQFYKLSGPLNLLTAAFTELLCKGSINTLVGTRSLLGEGWDAPVINSLVLASSVGSFMLTNQMRGRAIRIDKTSPDKVSSIWHLVAIDRISTGSGWSDFHELRQRFETFVGLSEKDLTIESGFDRLHATAFKIMPQNHPGSPIRANNWQMMRRFRKIDRLAERWRQALTIDASAKVVPSLKTAPVPGLRAHHIKNTLKYLLLNIAGAVIIGVCYSLGSEPESMTEVLILISVGIVGALLYKLPKTIAAIRILLKHLPVAGSIKQIGVALTSALCQAGIIETSFRRMKVRVMQDDDGSFYVALSGCSFYESSLFADAMAEILAPIDSPRYLVVRAGEMFGLRRDDYHAVPMKLGAKKELAKMFYTAWSRYVGPSELIYTRSPEGRKRLVKARSKAFSSTFARQVKRQDRWQASKWKIF